MLTSRSLRLKAKSARCSDGYEKPLIPVNNGVLLYFAAHGLSTLAVGNDNP